MFSGSVRPETSTSHPHHDQPGGHATDQQYSFNNHANRLRYEPPRPLEPRPTLHASLSDTTSMHRRTESYHPLGATSDYKAPGPSLPGLRDILPPAPSNSTAASYGNTSWHPPMSVPAQSRPQYAPAYIHPPMALEPFARTHQDARPRSWEMPILASGSEGSKPPQPSQSVPMSPYANYPAEYGQNPDTRYERTAPSAVGHAPSGFSSPYSAAHPEGSPFGGAVAGHERGQPPATSIASAEKQQRYLGIKDVPGEGTFHFYEGGHRIPTHVDGEHVNPAWGLTKANKPRKRLALACLDCREKKIKCEPGATSCLQCEKAKRTCRRSQAQQAQAESTATTIDWSPSGPSPSRNKESVSDPSPAPSRDVELEVLNKSRRREDSSPPTIPAKKHRSVSPVPAIVREAASPRKDSRIRDDMTLPLAKAGVISWDEDPYAIEPELTLHLLHLYFGHFNNETYCLFPQRHFMQWCTTRPDKCQNERMILYAMLATASVFADASLASFGRQCAEVAMEILPLRVGTIHMPTAQARMLLALYSFAKGEYTAMWEHSGVAIRAVQHLQYHTEPGCLDSPTAATRPRCEFDLSITQLAECRRRTFWSAFLLDRYCQGSVTMLKPQDVFVRLPCTEDSYESGRPSNAPWLNNGVIDPAKSVLTAASPVAPMAWHVLVASIWGDVADFIFRAPHQAAASYRDTYESFYTDIWNRLQGWVTRLPEYLQYGVANLEKSIQHGYAGMFVSLHALYHFCCMKLNRCLRHALAPDLVIRNIRAAHDHGHQMLQLICALNAARREIHTPTEGQPTFFTFFTPFLGYAAIAAVDIVSAGGMDSAIGTTLEEINSALVCLQELSRNWDSARLQARLCERRYYQIQNVLQNPLRARGGAWLGRKWGLEKPMEPDLSTDDDCIYGMGGTNEASDIYFDAFDDAAGRSKASTAAPGLA